jgi:hypothetical protein
MLLGRWRGYEDWGLRLEEWGVRIKTWNDVWERRGLLGAA